MVLLLSHAALFLKLSFSSEEDGTSLSCRILQGKLWLGRHRSNWPFQLFLRDGANQLWFSEVGIHFFTGSAAH